MTRRLLDLWMVSRGLKFQLHCYSEQRVETCCESVARLSSRVLGIHSRFERWSVGYVIFRFVYRLAGCCPVGLAHKISADLWLAVAKHYTYITKDSEILSNLSCMRRWDVVRGWLFLGTQEIAAPISYSDFVSHGSAEIRVSAPFCESFAGYRPTTCMNPWLAPISSQSVIFFQLQWWVFQESPKVAIHAESGK